MTEPDLGWRSLDSDELAREYSPSSCVEDIQPHLDAYASRSAAARAACEADGLEIVELRHGPQPANTIDLVTPHPSGGATPLLVFIHGGYWQALSKRESFFAAADCVRNGIAHAAVDYTLAPNASLDEIVAECVAAFRLLQACASDHNIDDGRIVVAGSSAGAHLAAMVALDLSGPPPAAVCLLSGVFELEPLLHTYVNDAVRMDLDAAHRNSPLRHDLAGFPPALVVHGDNETAQFKRQSAAFTTALEAAGGTATMFEAEHRNHFDIVHDLCDPTTPLGDATLALIRSTGPTRADST